MKKNLRISALLEPGESATYIVTPVATSVMDIPTTVFMGTEKECKEFVKNYKEEKPESGLSLVQKAKLILTVKYYEHVLPLFSNKLEKERMQVAAFITEPKDTKHWIKYQRALRSLKAGKMLIGASFEKLPKIQNNADYNTPKLKPVPPVPEVQAAIEALKVEAKNPQPWTGESSPEAAFPLNLTDKIINENKK